MEKKTYEPIEIRDLTDHLKRINVTIEKLDSWYEHLYKKTRQRLQNLYDAASGHLDDAKADISALTSTYLVCVAERLVKNEEEGRK